MSTERPPQGGICSTSIVILHIVFLPGFARGGINDHKANEASECFYEILSQNSKQGSFSSPHFPSPYPPNQRCTYIFQGTGSERIQIDFKEVDLNYDPLSMNSQDCSEAIQDAIIVRIKTPDAKREIAKYCAKSEYYMLMSSDNRLEVMFTTHDSVSPTAKGFNATYKFVTDFGIKSGLRNREEVCGFKFFSNRTSNGTFTSPNFPGMYPRNTECSYQFFGGKSQIVDITFPFFDVEGVPPDCDEISQSDYVEFSNFNIHDSKMDRFCGVKESSIKKEVQSDGTYFRVVFKSNDVYDARGFEAIYQFRNTGDPSPPEKHGKASRTSAVSATYLLPLVLIIVAHTLL